MADLDEHNWSEYVRRFSQDGYLLFPDIVSAEPLAQLSARLRTELARVKDQGELFSGGGTISGHLNCFPGAISRFVYRQLETAQLFDLVRALSPDAVRAPNIGCNMNLSRSRAQNHHIDGYASKPFLIVNVAVVPTTLSNGALELSAGSHLGNYKYWQFVLARHRAVRVTMAPGDVLIRPSSLWHRGMPNHTEDARPMLGFSWEEGGSRLDDPYSLYEGNIRFLPNRYAQSFTGRLRERAFATLPSFGSSYLFLRSLIG